MCDHVKSKQSRHKLIDRTCIISLRRTVSKGYEQMPAAAVTVCATAHLAIMFAFFSSLKTTPLAVSYRPKYAPRYTMIPAYRR